jgi:glycerol-3-phosphate dehydrogenase
MFSISRGSVGMYFKMDCSCLYSNLQNPYSYSGADPIGVELAGALKNVYAIAAGIADGLGFENNTRAST